MVWTFRPQTDAGAIVQPKPSLFLLLLRHFQPFASPDTLNPLVVHMPACVVEQPRHHAIAVTAVLIGQLDNIVGETFLIRAALRHLALRGSVLTECAAGPAL